MRRNVVLLLVSVLLGAGGLTACSDDDADDALDDARAQASEAIEEAQDVDWEAYPDDLRADIEEAIAEADCEGLNEQLEELDEGEDSELVAFLKEQVEDAGCA